MANANSPRGIIPYAYQSGSPYNGAVRTYYVPVGNATALYIGDPVVTITNSSDGNGIQSVGIATAGGGTQILGAFMGRTNNAGTAAPITLLQSNNVYLPAATAAYVMVCDDPYLLYWVQENGAMVSGASGRNADLVAGAGSTYSAYSGWQLNSATINTTSTLQMRIIQMLQESDNAVGTNAKWLCKINAGISEFTNATGT